MKPTITIDEANRRVEDYALKVREALPPQAKYDLYSSEERGSCSDPTDSGSKDRALASRSYEVSDLALDKIPSYFDALRTWWQNHNFRVLDNTPPDEYLWVENNTDGFRMTFKASPDKAKLFLIATSPCVWPDGTPLSAAEAGNQAPAETAFAEGSPQQWTPSQAPTQAPRRARRRPPVDDEDFDQTDWTDENTY